jgi:ferric-dicitrate binding protein FerR (iron transport regulator)
MEPLNERLFLEILAKYNAGRATKEEVAYLEAYYNLYEVNEVDATERASELQASVKAKIDAGIIGRSTMLRNITLRRYAAAAIILLALTAGLYFTVYQSRITDRQFLVEDRAPGGSKATLTLADGKVITIDDAVAGKIAQEAGTNIMSSADGTITYAGIHKAADIAATQLRNTVATPKGGQFKLVLADGTKVWLNSASSITFPAAFGPKSREVQLVGEAYFEVAKINHVPFQVKTANQMVEVLGTHFNVNAYADEGTTTTTLFEGSVRLSTGGSKKVLKPGEQAKVSASRTDIMLDAATNMDKVIAWKNGVFSFYNEDLETIMRQISRWYDVDVVYAGPLPKEKYFGEIPRNSKLSEVCRILELNNLSFEITGRTLKVSARLWAK